MRIALVSYINTWPFIWGLEKHPEYILLLDVPSRCLTYFQKGEADIALVPFGALIDTSLSYQLLPYFCIGAKKRVETVVLFSNSPLSELTTIYLDPESRTSNLLIQILCHHHWHIKPQFLYRETPTPISQPHTGNVCIGDKVFTLQSHYEYCYDLAEAWYQFTGKGFPFAVWIGKKELSSLQIQPFLKALESGIRDIPNHPLPLNHHVKAEYIYYYLTEVIDYHLDEEKLQSMALFRNLAKKIINCCVETK